MNEIPDILLLILPSEKSMFHKLKMLFVTLRKWGQKLDKKPEVQKVYKETKATKMLSIQKRNFWNILRMKGQNRNG